MYRTRCRCNCGSICFPQYSALVSGATKSCGCLRREVTSKNRTRHGASKDSGRWAEYGIWAAIKTRCTNSSSKAYKHYGGRGITICKRWSDSFLNFVADMGRRPNKYSQIDRVDNNLGYFPENCVWTSAKINVTRGEILFPKTAIGALLDELTQSTHERFLETLQRNGIVIR